MKSNGHINALVAGGAGFIGSHLCDRLIKNGYRVLCIDNLYTGRIENVCHMQRDVRFSFVNQDVYLLIMTIFHWYSVSHARHPLSIIRKMQFIQQGQMF